MTLSDAHKKRIITGIIMLAVLILCLGFGGWPLRLLLCLVSALALWEFYQMFHPGKTQQLDKGAGLFIGLLICLTAAHPVAASDPMTPTALPLSFAGTSGFAETVFLLIILSLYCATRFLVRYGQGDDAARPADHAFVLCGIAYIPLVLQLAMYLSLSEQIVVLLGAMASDVGAFYAGTFFGKHRMWPRVSPKKSWEGSIGGILAVMVTLTVFTAFADIPAMRSVSWWQWSLVGAILSVAAQMGDFFESALKRVQGIKDSSNILPGHGGVLDRVDSLLFVLPVYCLLRYLLG